MRMLSKAILAALVAVMIGGTIALASGGTGVTPSPSTMASSERAVPSTTAADVKGPCDEAEHANDARCDGAQVPEDRNDDNGGVHEQEGPDDSGHHSSTEISTGNSGPRGGEIEAGDDSGHSTEMEAGDDSGRGSDNSGHHRGSGRNHSEDN
ncbi:MAG TPA: hypothetical protein VHV50_00180 [Actinomycetota bacterium]|jgi:hypothetical protein|nr:hypothetical protein [Actinomycetota bacterium]